MMMTYKDNQNNFFSITEVDSQNNVDIFNISSAELTLIWNRGSIMRIYIDKVCHEISRNNIFFLNSFHAVENVDLIAARVLRFSKASLLVSGHENKIDFSRLFRFSGEQLQIIAIDEIQLNHLENAWAFFGNEMNSEDELQKDMLSLLLKRILSLCFSSSTNTKIPNCEGHKKYLSDIVTSFNFLVEDHFSEHHDVAFYASKLNISPKTLSILFSLSVGCPPKNFIHDRIMVDARNQIQYTHKSIKEIAYDLGYEDIQTFSRFFKNKEGVSPIHYREKLQRVTS